MSSDIGGKYGTSDQLLDKKRILGIALKAKLLVLPHDIK